MEKLTKTILAVAAAQTEGDAISARALLHLGSRAAVDQTLSRLARSGKLLRVGRGLYALPVETRFGQRPPSAKAVVEALRRAKGETIVSHGATAANALGLTTQVPMRSVFLTSGRSRTLTLGKQTVELRHAPAWQLAMAGSPAGDAIRALAWLGKGEVNDALRSLQRRLPQSTMAEIARVRAQLPTWLAEQVSRVVVNG